MNTPTNSEALPLTNCSPSFLCRVIGHHWTCKKVDEQTSPGYRITTKEMISHCRRCGMPNPIYFHSENSGMGDGYCPIFDKFTDPDHGKRCTAFQPNVKGHASPEHAPKIDQTASSASHVPTCYPSSD